MKPKILVIRGGAIGDFILTLPAINLLREAFASAHLEILGYKHIVALAEGRYYADATRSIEYGAMSGFFVPNAELAPDLVEYFGSFQQIISYLYDPDGIFEQNLRRAGVKQILNAYERIDDSEHAARQLARPLQSLALYLEEHAARLFPTSEDRAAADEFLSGFARRPLVAVHPGSGSAKKNWTLARWEEVITHLRMEFPTAGIILIGGEADYVSIDRLSGLVKRGRCLIARDLPLPHLAAIVQRVELFLGHDSGISHLAAAVGTRSILVFGPTDPHIWAPANANVQVIQAPDGDLEKLETSEVLEPARSILRKSLR